MKRRAFLASSSLVVVLPGCALPVIPQRPAPSLEDAAGWVGHTNGRFMVRLPRAEMGQNVATAFQQIACDELEVPWDTVRVVLANTAAFNRVKATVGSESIRDFALPFAQACATLRLALAEGSSGRVLAARELPISSLRAFSKDAKWVGVGGPQVQGREIVTGAPLFAADVRLPDMVYGRVLRAPASPERRSRPVQWDEAAARRTPGFVDLFQDDRLTLGNARGLAIAGRTPSALDRIEAALAVRWELAAPASQRSLMEQIDVGERLAKGSLEHVTRKGSVETTKAWTVDVRLDVPLAAHAAMEPRSAVARWDGQYLEGWVGAQDLFYQRDVIAKFLSLQPERVRLQNMRIGGAFGGKTLCTVELEAALLALRLQRPVKVQWTRAQELGHGFHRPPSSHRIRAKLQDGQLTAWWHAFSSSHILFTNAGMPPWLQSVSRVVGDAGVARGSKLAYRCPNERIEYDLSRLEALTGPWRGLGAGPNLLAIESAIDECARAAGDDPVAFRLRHIDDPRLAEVVQRAATAAKWGQPPPSSTTWRRGRGFACGIYKEMSYAAAVAEVAVNKDTGEVRVTDIWCAHDCGRVIDPDQVRAQTEGNLVWCIGMVLIEELPFVEAAVQARTFAESRIPRIGDIGRLHTELVVNEHPPTGAGETAMVAGAGAIANALRAAVGARFARVPVRQQDVLAALRNRSTLQ